MNFHLFSITLENLSPLRKRMRKHRSQEGYHHIIPETSFVTSAGPSRWLSSLLPHRELICGLTFFRHSPTLVAFSALDSTVVLSLSPRNLISFLTRKNRSLNFSNFVSASQGIFINLFFFLITISQYIYLSKANCSFQCFKISFHVVKYIQHKIDPCHHL